MKTRWRLLPPIGLFVLDTDLRFLRINAYLAGLNGRPAAAHLGRTIREMVPGLAEQAEPLLCQVLQTGVPALNLELSGDVDNSTSGQREWRAHYHPLRNPAGAIVGLTGMVEEVTALKQAERELRASEQRYRELSARLEQKVEARTAEIRAADTALRESEACYRTIFDSVIDAIFILDLEGRFLAVNEHACHRYGYTRDEFLRLHITAIDVPEDASQAPARIAAVDRDGLSAFEARHRDARGQPLAVEVRASRILFDGRPAILGVVRDITERQRAEALLRENEERFRRLFHDTRQPLCLVEDGQIIATNQATLSMLRLERPEQLLGRTPVDFSPPDQPDGRPSAEKSAEMIRIACEQGVHEFEWEHLRADGERFPAIILLTAISERNKTLLHIVWNDITAQKRAQERASYLAYYDALTGLSNRLLGLDRLAKKVAQAKRHQRQLAVLYLDLDHFKHVNDRHGHLLGDKLLQCVSDVAEESGLIVPLGTWVLREACRQAAAWRAAGWPDLVVAVNLSAVQFRRGGIGDEVLAALAATGLDPAGLALELTESILLQDADAILETVSAWKAAGIQLAIDDFGTGYSSLAYLKRFQVDKLKIDRSFISGMADHEQDQTIVQAIIDLAGGLALRTIAEGVEDARLASQLWVMGCDEAQGYLYAPPLAAADLERWLGERGES
jgi:PAS domain S-box-containing protein